MFYPILLIISTLFIMNIILMWELFKIKNEKNRGLCKSCENSQYNSQYNSQNQGGRRFALTRSNSRDYLLKKKQKNCFSFLKELLEKN